MKDTTASMTAMGEPFLSGFEPGKISEDLANTGLRLEEDTDDIALLQRYDPEGLNGFVCTDRSRIARARVNK